MQSHSPHRLKAITGKGGENGEREEKGAGERGRVSIMGIYLRELRGTDVAYPPNPLVAAAANL